mmetsp:Transcript_117274/g.378461  ORF Transcript_117274/g.378461 Transcript_117274/m.378461 type:complete len:279 (+) Transcript_117274:284-1120(+)
MAAAVAAEGGWSIAWLKPGAPNQGTEAGGGTRCGLLAGAGRPRTPAPARPPLPPLCEIWLMACWFLAMECSIMDWSTTLVEAVSTIIWVSSAVILKLSGKSRRKSMSFFAWWSPCFRCCTRGSWPSSCKGTLPPRRDRAWRSSMRSACIFSLTPTGLSMRSGSMRSASLSSRSRIASASGSAACAPGCSLTVQPPVRPSGASSKTSSYCLRMSRSRTFLNMESFFSWATLKSEPIWESVTAWPPCISKALKSALAISESFFLSSSLAAAMAGVQTRSW